MARATPLSDKHPLPHIISPTLERQVFTHRSAVGAPAGLSVDSEPATDNDRLAFLGDGVIHMLATHAVEANKPLSRRGDLDNIRALLVARDRTAAWADAYDLPKRLIVHKSQQALIPHNQAAKVQVFQAYVGAVFKEHGYSCVEEWFAPVLDDALCEIQEFGVHNLLLGAALEDGSEIKAWRKRTVDLPEAGNEGIEPVLPIACPPKPGDAPGPPATGTGTRGNGASDLALFNEKCMQKLKGAQANWLVTSTGPPHSPEFTATVTLPGDLNPVGIGIGTNQKLARQQAAGVALSTLGWD